MKAIDVLREVKRRIIADPKQWHRGSDGFGSDSGPCCVVGHVVRVGGRSLERNFAIDRVRLAMGGSVETSFTHWNDHPERTVWDVIAMLGKAIRSLEVPS